MPVSETKLSVWAAAQLHENSVMHLGIKKPPKPIEACYVVPLNHMMGPFCYAFHVKTEQ